MTDTLASERQKRGGRSFEKGAEILRHQIKTLPSSAGVYRMLAASGAVLYVGKAKNLKKRVSSYTQASRLPVRLQRMVAQTRDLEIVLTHTESEALLLEANLIQKLKPPFNVLLRDDKSFPFILITRDHAFPQLAKHRGAKKRKGDYFGPFASGGAVTETLTHLQRAFKLRTCTDSFFARRARPCLQYHIKRCAAPCVNKIGIKDYGQHVTQACAFLRGEGQALQSTLAKDMQSASDKLEFERAAALRDRIRVLTSIQARQDINIAGLGDADIIAIHKQGGISAVQVFFFRADRHYGARVYFPLHGKEMETSEILSAFLGQFYASKEPPNQILFNEKPTESTLLKKALEEKAKHKVHFNVPKMGDKKRLVGRAQDNAAQALARKMADTKEQKKILAQLAAHFDLPKPPARIEVYDNSHISGAHAVGAMIAAGTEGFLKKTYRKFNIKAAKGNDDFGMMKEVLERRFKRLLTEDTKQHSDSWPDLLLIDGGAGQIGKVQKILDELNVKDVALIGIAKGPNRNAGQERFFMTGKKPLRLSQDDPVLYYLQRLRDEAHRFAITTHRTKRSKAMTHSSLEEISGIGSGRKKALLHAFGSAKAVEGAGIKDLARVPQISSALAKKIYDYYHDDV